MSCAQENTSRHVFFERNQGTQPFNTARLWYDENDDNEDGNGDRDDGDGPPPVIMDDGDDEADFPVYGEPMLVLLNEVLEKSCRAVDWFTVPSNPPEAHACAALTCCRRGGGPS